MKNKTLKITYEFNLFKRPKDNLKDFIEMMHNKFILMISILFLIREPTNYFIFIPLIYGLMFDLRFKRGGKI